MFKCCICGIETDVQEFPTYLKEEKVNIYCKHCLLAGYEPYEDLVNLGWEYGMFSQSYRQKIITPTLTLNRKTVKEFNEDVQKKRDEKNATV